MNTLTELPASMQKRVFINETTGCWEWTGRKDRDGYGLAYDPLTKRSQRAHRLAYAEQLAVPALSGPELDSLLPATRDDQGRRLVVSHKCGNRACCNPAHLVHEIGRASCRARV